MQKLVHDEKEHSYWFPELVHDEKEHSDWFPEQSKYLQNGPSRWTAHK